MVDAKNYLINGPRKSYQINGFGLRLVALKNEGTPMGICGLKKRDALENCDIGFAFLPEWEGKGYAYEASYTTIHYAQNVLKLSTILAITQANNSNSLKTACTNLKSRKKYLKIKRNSLCRLNIFHLFRYATKCIA